MIQFKTDSKQYQILEYIHTIKKADLTTNEESLRELIEIIVDEIDYENREDQLSDLEGQVSDLEEMLRETEIKNMKFEKRLKKIIEAVNAD